MAPFTGRERAADVENWRELNALWASGAIRPKISAHYPLAEEARPSAPSWTGKPSVRWW